MSLTPEQIAAIATQAALAAVAAATGGTVAAVPSPSEPVVQEPEYDEAADEAAALETIEANEAQARAVEPIVAELLPLIMQERHLVVFRWLARERGVSDAELIRQVVRATVALETPNWREATSGKISGSTKSAATMAALRGE